MLAERNRLLTVCAVLIVWLDLRVQAGGLGSAASEPFVVDPRLLLAPAISAYVAVFWGRIVFSLAWHGSRLSSRPGRQIGHRVLRADFTSPSGRGTPSKA